MFQDYCNDPVKEVPLFARLQDSTDHDDIFEPGEIITVDCLTDLHQPYGLHVFTCIADGTWYPSIPSTLPRCIHVSPQILKYQRLKCVLIFSIYTNSTSNVEKPNTRLSLLYHRTHLPRLDPSRQIYLHFSQRILNTVLTNVQTGVLAIILWITFAVIFK